MTFSVKPSAIVTTILASPTTSCSGAVAYPSSSNCPLKDGGIPTLSYGTVNGATSAVPYLAYTMTVRTVCARSRTPRDRAMVHGVRAERTPAHAPPPLISRTPSNHRSDVKFVNVCHAHKQTAAQARRFCVSSLQWTFWYVSGNNVFTSDPAEDTTSAGWYAFSLRTRACMCGRWGSYMGVGAVPSHAPPHQRGRPAVCTCTPGVCRTMTTLNYNNAATLAPIQSSFSQPTINIIAGCAHACMHE